MANHITNDRGETVIAVGAPGSQARMQCEFPALIERLNAIHQKGVGPDGVYTPGADREEALAEVRAAGISVAMDTNSVLDVSNYGKSYAQWKRHRSLAFDLPQEG